MANQNLKSDSPLARRIARSFLQFLNSVELSGGADNEALEVAKDCLAEVFGIDSSSLSNSLDVDSLIDIFQAREGVGRTVVDNGGVSNASGVSLAKNASALENEAKGLEPHSPGHDELFGKLFDALEKINYFRRMPDGNDDQNRIDRATCLFHRAVEEMQVAGSQTVDMKSLAETFKSQGNKAMQSSIFDEAIELYTFAIALCEDNAVYYCNRAAAYTHVHKYDEAVRDCLRSMEINPNYSKAYSRLGFAYYAQGKYRDAIKGFKKALQLDPNNESVKENLRVSEQKLREEYRRSGPGQSSSTSTSNGRSSHQNGSGSARNNSSIPSPFTSLPFNINNLPPDITSLFVNMTGTTEAHDHEHDDIDEQDDEPGLNFGGNINVDVNDLQHLPEELMRSMMGMFSRTGPQGNHQEDGDRR